MKSRFNVFFVVLLLVSQTALVKIKAQESEFKDTPWFSGMPSYYIYDAEDVEFEKLFGRMCRESCS